jgi:hypothetical protein
LPKSLTLRSEIAENVGGGTTSYAVMDRFVIHRRDAKFILQAREAGIDPMTIEIGGGRVKADKTCMKNIFIC